MEKHVLKRVGEPEEVVHASLIPAKYARCWGMDRDIAVKDGACAW